MEFIRKYSLDLDSPGKQGNFSKIFTLFGKSVCINKLL